MKIITAAAIIVCVGAVISPLVSIATEHGAPSGAHFKLNIIAASKDKAAGMTGKNGHRMFVELFDNTKISLVAGSDYQVLDVNGTDENGASFQLPNPDPDNDGVTAYRVYARVLGKSGNSTRATSCVTDAGGTFCSSGESVVRVRSTGKSSFTDVSKELLTVCVDANVDGVCDARVGLFDDATADYFWKYDNNGLKLAQLRFYEIP